MDINYIAPHNFLGYGQTGRNILKNLVDLGANVAFFPIGKIETDNSDNINYIKKSLNNQSYYNNKAPSLRIWHQHDLAMHVGRGPHIGMPIFELDQFNNIELHHLKSQDVLFVCSDWAKKIINNHTSVPTFVVPLGVDNKVFDYNLCVEKQKNEPTIFFNCGKWEYRKGHDLISTAFNLAFSKDDNVELWMMCDNPFLNQQQTEQWHNYYMQSELGIAGKIKLIPRVNSNLEVAQIMAKTDCGVFPARAEGWNLELLEMMAMGKQVIATNYAAHTHYCNNSNSLLLEPEGSEPAVDGVWFYGQGAWATLGEDTIKQIVEHMRYVHNNKTVNTEGIKTGQKFTWKNSAQTLIKHLETICKI